MLSKAAHIKLAEAGLALADVSGVEEVCSALESGRLCLDSTAPVRAALSGGSGFTERAIEVVQQLWRLEFPHLPADALALTLRAAAQAGAERARQFPKTEVVWTGPKVEGSFLRATREVVREILRGAQSQLFVIGYWIAARDDGEGIIEEIIESLGKAVRRGVSVTMILDERPRADARDNYQILLNSWSPGTPLPVVLTWHLPPDDQHLKLHAKVLVADMNDALVTSANLTFYALDKNMEMGVRVMGTPAKEIHDHFRHLIDSGVLSTFSERSSS